MGTKPRVLKETNKKKGKDEVDQIDVRSSNGSILCLFEEEGSREAITSIGSCGGEPLVNLL